MLKRLLRRPAVQAAVAHLLGLYLGFALRTTRWQLDGFEHAAPHIQGAPAIIAFWHERLPLMPMLWVLARRLDPRGGQQGDSPMRAHVLVSRHRDGRFIGAMVRQFGLDLVHGSSASRRGSPRGGPTGLRTLLTLLERGDHVAITPDGPRGPRRLAAPGVAQLAALSGVPVLPCAAQIRGHRELRSWDRMVIARPFARGVVVCGAPVTVPREDWERHLPAVAAALDAAAERADRLCA